MPKHPSHKTQTPRINRAIGQLEAIKCMINEEKYCVDIMTQLRAARNAIKTVELGVLGTHMEACMVDACSGDDEKLGAERIKEIMQLLKKYE